MPEQTPESPKRKTAPPRNDLKSSGLYKNSRALEMMGQDPNFHYQPFSTDPDSPGYIGKRLRRHEIGNQRVGFATVEPWEVVHDLTDADVRALDPRDDQGKKVDTVARYGRQVWCRIPKAEYAKYETVDEALQKDRRAQIFGTPDRSNEGGIAMTAAVSDDENMSQQQLLRQSGHPGI